MATTRKTTSKKTSAKKASKKPIDLFMGVFPTGIMYADMNRRENGDYKELAFVFFNGVIRWNVDKKTLPSKLVYKILKESRDNARKHEADNIERNRILDTYILRNVNNKNPKANDWIIEKRWDTNYAYKQERQKYLDYLADREKAIHTYPAKRRR